MSETTPQVEWTRLTAAELNALAAAGAIAVLPVASTEQHGPHLGTGVDTLLCGAVCLAGARLAAPKRPVVVAPTLFVGMAEHHMAHGGTLTLDVPTYRAVLFCLLRSLEHHGFARTLIVNGHGGNVSALNALLPDMSREFRMDVSVTTYFELAQPRMPPLLEDQTGVRHACEVETSMMMVVAPDAVRPGKLTQAYGPSFTDSREVLMPVVQQFRSIKSITPSGVVGDARRASTAKGEKLLTACAEELARLLVEL